MVETPVKKAYLEATEKRFRWPPRSGKIVLKLALDRLAAHYGIAMLARGATARLAVPGGGEARIISDSYAQLAALATEGMGIACLPSPIAARGLETGLLERIEAGWEPPSANLYLVYPTRRDMSARVKAFAAHLTALLARSN